MREVITNEKADKRREIYRKSSFIGSLVTIHNVLDEPMYTIDSIANGNVSKFFHHSRDPNMLMVEVNTGYEWKLNRYALFASKDIEKGDELTW